MHYSHHHSNLKTIQQNVKKLNIGKQTNDYTVTNANDERQQISGPV